MSHHLQLQTALAAYWRGWGGLRWCRVKVVVVGGGGLVGRSMKAQAVGWLTDRCGQSAAVTIDSFQMFF